MNAEKAVKKLKKSLQRKTKKNYVRKTHYRRLKARVKELEAQLSQLSALIDAGAENPHLKDAAATIETASPNLGEVYLDAPDERDNLQRIKGVGAVLEKKLNEFGIYRFAQIAAWTDDIVEEFSKRLNFKGRIQREKWIQQAKELSA